LLAATSLYEKAKDYHAAAAMSAFLVEVHPRDGPAHATFGHALRLNSEFDRAEGELKRAVEFGVKTPQINEDFARIYVARKDERGALPYSQEVLRLDPKQQDVWYFQGEVAEKAQNPTLAIQSYEQGMALGGVHVVEAGALIRLYVAAKHADQAEQLANTQLDTLPPESAPRIELAAILDDLRQNALALRAWRRVLEVQPNSERAHTRVARLMLEQGDAPGAEQAAIAGLVAVPTSPTLYLCKADAQEAQGRRYEARTTLREGIAAIQDPILQDRAATNEERYAWGAPEAYARLAELSIPSSAEQVRAFERGFYVSMRDGDQEHAHKFETLLEASGHREFRALLVRERQPIASFSYRAASMLCPLPPTLTRRTSLLSTSS
jgi:tetratricopeptide (TPR) repeat protein